MAETKTFSIIGGGIAGLTLAVALQRNGIAAHVYDNAPELKPVGAGLVLAANAMKAFRELGLDEQVMNAGKQMKRFCIRDLKGKVLSIVDTDRIRRKWNLVHTLAIHRADLHRLLENQLRPGTLHLGKGCSDFTPSDRGVLVEFKDGTSMQADFVIAADGIHSIFRKRLLPQASLRYSGYTCWRGITSSVVPGLNPHEAFESWGAGKRFGAVPLEGDRLYWYATVDATENDSRLSGYSVSDLVALFDEFHSPVPDIIMKTDSAHLIRNDIYDFPPLKQFAFSRIVLCGDAAHATTPNMGQGACMAIEDAVTLTNCIKRDPDPVTAFKTFEQMRIARTSRIVNTSFLMGRMGQWKHPLMVAVRNAAIRFTPQRVSEKQLDFLFDVSFT